MYKVNDGAGSTTFATSRHSSCKVNMMSNGLQALYPMFVPMNPTISTEKISCSKSEEQEGQSGAREKHILCIPVVVVVSGVLFERQM